MSLNALFKMTNSIKIARIIIIIICCSELSKVKVIDMTGPQQRILSGYHALSGLKAPPGVEHFEDVVHKKCSNFALPEIQHNLDLLVNMCEQVIEFFLNFIRQKY